MKNLINLLKSFKNDDFAETLSINRFWSLIEASGDINYQYDSWQSILMFCSCKDNLSELVKLILENWADVNLINKNNGVTALFLASYLWAIENVKILLANKNIDKNIKAFDWKTALDIAQEQWFTEIVNLLKD